MQVPYGKEDEERQDYQGKDGKRDYEGQGNIA